MKDYFDYFFNDLLKRMKVDVRILDFNYSRMQHVLQLFIRSRIRILNAQQSTMSMWEVKEQEYPSLLEFYLQMDVDLFYMKTCSFRKAQLRSEQEGLFCIEIPECRYTMTPCGHCDLCQQSSLSIEFNRYERHRFVNGYESILNAPATCSTTNIIYVLTCPCGKYDYIGETSQTLGQCLRRHRQRAHGIQQTSELATCGKLAPDSVFLGTIRLSLCAGFLEGCAGCRISR